jgi:DNA polymerase III subunit epsilon
MIKLCYLDLETSGLDSNKHGIVQIAGQIEVPGKDVCSFAFPVKLFQEDCYDSEAMKMHGSRYLEGEEPKKVHRLLTSLFGGFVDKFDKQDKFQMVGYNVTSFDAPFLRKFFEKSGDKYFGSWFWWPPIDVMSMAAFACLKCRCELPNFKLGTVCKHFGVDFDDKEAHDAVYDVVKTRELYKKVCECLGK